MDHDAPWTVLGHSNASFHEYGGWGVYLFFAISGLLVCTRILEDESLLGRFRIRDFYIRRFFRIQPPAIVYLTAIALLSWMSIAHERRASLLGGLFLYQNYLIDISDTSGRWFLTGHFWTLAIEEHFYVLLSALLFFFKRQRVRIFSGLLILLYVCQRLVLHFRLYSSLSASRHTELNLQYLLTPALFALLLRRKGFRDAIVRYLHPWVAFVGTVLLKQLWFLLHPLPAGDIHPRLDWFLVPPELLFYAFEVWVVATMLHPRSWTTRLLELSPLRFLGRLSYSIYLWHALFLIGRLPQTALHARWLLFLTERPWRYPATLALSMASYYWVERPLIRVGHRLAPPATPGHRDLAPELADAALA